MSIKLTYTRAEVQELLDKIEKGDFDNAKTLEGHPASYFAVASEFTSLAGSFATEQGRVNTLYSYFNNGSANDALSLGGQLPSYYATATQYEILQQTLADFKSLFDSMFEVVDGNIHAKLSLWSSGGITAGGVGSGGSGGGGASYDRLDAWADYSADKSGWVLSALLGNDLNNRLTSVENAGYVTASTLAPYALRSEIPSLVGYATESFVTSQGYITASALGGYATQSWVESKNYLTGITSAMVTTVLGYTPYNSANFTKANIKSTLGISDWALASAKPTYTASEVGALGVNDTAANASKLDGVEISNMFKYYGFNTDLSIFEEGNYQTTTHYINSTDSTITNAPGYYGTAVNFGARVGNFQLFASNIHKLYFRQRWTSNWGNWKTIAFTSDIPTKLSQLTDDVVAGKYLSLAGGTIESSSGYMLTLNRVSDAPTLIAFQSRGIITGFIGISQNGEPLYLDSSAVYHRLIHESNINNYALSINGGTLTGNVTAPTFTGVINSVEPKALLLSMSYTAGQYSRSASEEDGKIFIGSSANNNVISSPNYDGNNTTQNIQSLKLAYNSGFFTEIATTPNSDHLWKRNVMVSTAKPWERFVTEKVGVTWNISITGNADSATKLQTARTIWGQSFDGTGDITGALTAPSITAPSITIGGVTLTYDSVNEALCINGNMYALGGITAGGAGISAYTSLESRVTRIEQQLNIS